MNKFRRYYKSSITRRFVTMMVISLSLIFIGALYVIYSTISLVQDYEAETREINIKQGLVSQIASYSNEIIIHARGYYVYLSDFEQEHIYISKQNLDEALMKIKALKLSGEERAIMENIEDFFSEYFEQVIPQASEYARQQDYTSLRNFVTADKYNPVNAMIRYSNDFERQVQRISEEQNNSMIKQLIGLISSFTIYTLLVLITTSFITRKVSKDIGVPLGQLTQLSRQFANGEPLDEVTSDREDELGELARSFQSMIGQIQAKEEELLAQNEELIAQQDELQAQQEALQHAIAHMEQNEKYLEKRNQLIQALSSTIDQQELLDSIIRNIVELTDSDKGLIVMMNEQHSYASIGISESMAANFIATINEGIVVRAVQTKNAYTMSRRCSSAEQGYHQDEFQANELVIPILNANDDVVACLILTKMNRAITKQEETDIVGMMKQVSLAFDKLQLYEYSESQRLMTRDILNTIQEGIQYLDMSGTTLQINRRMSEILGFFHTDQEEIQIPLAAFIGHLRTAVIHPEPLIEYIEGLFSQQLADHHSSLNYEIDGPERRIIQIYCETLYRNNEPFGLLLVHRDQTKEYEVDRMKSEFVSTVSHELRTPLASVLGFAELMLYKELKPERQRKYVAMIHQEAVRLTTLINDFLDLQRMESGKQSYDMERLSLMPLIEEVIDSLQVNTALHTFEWHNEADKVNVRADREKMRQLFINLLSNAVKYSPNGGKIRLVTRQLNHSVEIRIEDEGLGIPSDALPNLFSKFYRVDNTDRREIGGTGLGLAIVKEIITKHKGSIEVQSVYGEGSTFIITLPLAPAEEEMKHELQHSMQLSDHSKRVMLIENDHNLSVMLREELHASGYQVFVYNEGFKAVEEMEHIRPDIIVIDLKLEPGITGWDIISRIKKSDALINVPIIISSAFEEKEKAAQWGIEEFLIKPYLPGKLSAAITRLLQ